MKYFFISAEDRTEHIIVAETFEKALEFAKSSNLRIHVAFELLNDTFLEEGFIISDFGTHAANSRYQIKKSKKAAKKTALTLKFKSGESLSFPSLAEGAQFIEGRIKALKEIQHQNHSSVE